MFRAARVDYSLYRLSHYTGTDAEHFQNFVIFTNYRFYVDVFARLGHEHMASGHPGSEAFVEPGKWSHATRAWAAEHWRRPDRMPQMPAYHLVEPGYRGITMINIGIGPSNARTITDHVAVLRPHAWLMLGHCAGLRNSQELGDYVLAHAYVREDHVLDDELPPYGADPGARRDAGGARGGGRRGHGLHGFEIKRIMRTGTVASVDNRNWEIGDPTSSDACRSRAPSRSTWSRRPSPPTAFASASPTARCSASPTSRSTAKSSWPAWPANSIASASASILRSG